MLPEGVRAPPEFVGVGWRGAVKVRIAGGSAGLFRGVRHIPVLSFGCGLGVEKRGGLRFGHVLGGLRDGVSRQGEAEQRGGLFAHVLGEPDRVGDGGAVDGAQRVRDLVRFRLKIVEAVRAAVAGGFQRDLRQRDRVGDGRGVEAGGEAGPLHFGAEGRKVGGPACAARGDGCARDQREAGGGGTHHGRVFLSGQASRSWSRNSRAGRLAVCGGGRPAAGCHAAAWSPRRSSQVLVNFFAKFALTHASRSRRS